MSPAPCMVVRASFAWEDTPCPCTVSVPVKDMIEFRKTGEGAGSPPLHAVMSSAAAPPTDQQQAWHVHYSDSRSSSGLTRPGEQENT